MIEKSKKYKLIYLITFFVINLLDVMLIVVLNRGFNWETTFFMVINSLVGNLGIILFSFALTILVSKNDKSLCRGLMIGTIFFSVFMFGISLYYGYYKMYPSFYNLKTFGGEGGLESLDFLLGSVFKLFSVSQPLYLLPILVIIPFFIFLFTKYKKDEEYSKHQTLTFKKRMIIGFSLVVISILLVFSSQKLKEINVKDTWHEDNTTVLYGIQSTGAYSFYLVELKEFLSSEKAIDYSRDKTFLEELDASKNETSINLVTSEEIKNSQYQSIFKDKNLLLIQMESLSNFLIGLKVKINDELVEVTPNLNELVGKSVYFSNYYTTVGIGNTSDAEFSVLTGLAGVGNLYTVYEFMGENYEALPKLFKEKGYNTFSTHANVGYYYLRDTLHVNSYGFDAHIDQDALTSEGIITPDTSLVHDWLGDEEFLINSVDRMASLYKETSKPVFDFSITVSCHIPYEIEDEDSFFGKKDLIFPSDFEDIEERFSNYLEHASYADYAIGKALDRLEELNIQDDTVVILYGDHGMGLEIYKMFYDTPELFVNDINPIIEYEEDSLKRELLEQMFLLEVPLFIYDASQSGVLPSQTIDLVRSHTSLKRTICNLFSLDEEYHFGIDCLSNAKTLSYNPRNLTFIVDGAVASASSGKYVCINDYSIDKETLEKWRTEALRIKSFNDKILKYKVFAK